MQIVIDVPDKVYEMVMNTGTYGLYRFNSTRAIRKGIPLDKIRAEIENDWQLNKYPSSPFSCGLRRAIEIIDKYKAEGEDKE